MNLEHTMRTPILLALAAAALAACAFYPSSVDERFGSAVMGARAQQTVDPGAAARRGPPAGIDGQAAKASVERYEKSFEVPPPPVNVLNIGIGSGTTSSSK